MPSPTRTPLSSIISSGPGITRSSMMRKSFGTRWGRSASPVSGGMPGETATTSTSGAWSIRAVCRPASSNWRPWCWRRRSGMSPAASRRGPSIPPAAEAGASEFLGKGRTQEAHRHECDRGSDQGLRRGAEQDRDLEPRRSPDHPRHHDGHSPHDEQTYDDLRWGNYRLRIMEGYQGVTDNVAPFYAQLDRSFPGSKF